MATVQRHRARDVLVTGIGAWTPYGLGWPAVWEGLAAGRPAFAAAGEGRAHDPEQLVGQIGDWALFRSEFPRARPPLPIPSIRLALVAAGDALRSAQLNDDERQSFGVMLNRCRGSSQVVVELMKPILTKGPRKTSPLLFSQSVANASLDAVATAFGLRGPHLMTLGGGAILAAFDAIQRGDTPGVLVGGLQEHVGAVFEADLENGFFVRRRAGDGHAAGPVLTEGAVVLVLESRGSCEQRGAVALAELRAVERGSTRAAGEVDSVALWGRPDPLGVAELIEHGLARAGVSVETVGFVAGSRVGLADLDDAERAALEHLGLSTLCAAGRVGSIKHLLGEGMGMAGCASLAWASTMVARGELVRATTGVGAGLAEFTAPRTTVVSHFDAHASQLAAVLTEAA